MSMLANVSKGKIIRPALVLLYGPGGIGKSTFGAKAPSPIFLGAEEGTDHLDVSRLPTPKTYADVITCLQELLTAPHDFKTLVVDSLDWIEPLIFQMICKKYGKDSIELAAGGYGKGYLEAADEWAKFRTMLTALRDQRKMNIILLAHPEIVKITNPQTQTSYERYEMKLHKRSKQQFMEYVDAMFFVSYAFYTRKGEGDQILITSTTQRVLHPNWKDGFDAKNRYGLHEPVDLNLTWDEMMTLFSIAPKIPLPSWEEVKFKFDELIQQVKDEEVLAKAQETLQKATAEKNVALMIKMNERLTQITGN